MIRMSEFKELSLDELATELRNYIDTGIESKKLKEHKAAMTLKDIANIKRKNTFNKYFKLYEKAKDLEKKKDVEGALAIYFEILDKYIPEGSVYYERPCIVLEKLKRYDEAIAICNLAITRIDNQIFNFPKEEFEKRLDRLIRKKSKGDKNE